MSFENSALRDDNEFNRDEVYRQLIHEAPKFPGDTGLFIRNADDSIPWLNNDLLKQGQDFVARNYLAINLSSIGTLMVGLGLKTVSTILFRNQKFSGVQESMTRFVETGEHMNSWYDAKIYEKTGKSYKDLQVVRKMHALVLKRLSKNDQPNEFVPDESMIEGRTEKEKFLVALKKDLDCVGTSGEDSLNHLMTYNPPIFMSQYDLAITQYGFFAFVVMAPKSLGISDRRGMDGFIHLWAVLGRLLGIQDRFNLALYPDKRLYERIYDKVVIACLKDADLSAINAQFAFGEGIGKLLVLSSPKSLLYFGLSSKEMSPEFEGKHMKKLMSWSDVTILRILQILLLLVYHFDFVRDLGNRLYMRQAARNKTWVKQLKKNQRKI